MAELPIFIKYLFTIILGATPIIELRYAAIIAQYAFGLTPLQAFICGLIGNIIPVYFIVKYIRPFFDFFGRWKPFKIIIDWASEKATKKIAENPKLQTVTAFALFVFVAVPIPTTGAWVGSLIANFLDLPPKKAVPPIVLGTIAAGCITIIANRRNSIFVSIKLK